MKPYARKGKKIRINNRSKFNSGSRKVSWEFSPRNCSVKISPLSLIGIRIRKAKGLTADQYRHYATAML